MKPRISTRRTRLPEPHGEEGAEPIDLYFEEDEDAASSEYIVLSQAREMSALGEYLHDLQEQDRVPAI